MNKIFGYIRVSDKSQISGDGFKRQETVIKEYTKRNNMEVVNFFREDVSGTKDETDRPIFQEMVSAILSNGVRMIVVESLDRLARSFRIQETLLIYLASKGVDVISARTGENVTESLKADPLRRALVQIQAVFSELEKNQIVYRLRAARQRKRDQGLKSEGRYGYADTPEGQAIIRRIRALHRKPRYGKCKTFQQIADILNNEGITTFDGKKWSLHRVQQVFKN